MPCFGVAADLVKMSPPAFTPRVMMHPRKRKYFCAAKTKCAQTLNEFPTQNLFTLSFVWVYWPSLTMNLSLVFSFQFFSFSFVFAFNFLFFCCSIWSLFTSVVVRLFLEIENSEWNFLQQPTQNFGFYHFQVGSQVCSANIFKIIGNKIAIH